ncbi:MAG TPA: hypothetical protein PKC54_04290 [Ferruginibacter sp.]|nr:hypothetical protein [Ferruginibacter sp.]
MARGLLFTLLALGFASLQTLAQFTSVSFSVQAHEDDWQLFMSSRIVADLNVSNRKVVFITLTAGDGSAGAASYAPSNIPFYLSRENGSVYSSKYAADITTVTAPLDVPLVSNVTINGKTIAKYTYKNTVNYFLRLPDGNGDGSGFNNNGFQSLQKLRAGTITAMNVVGYTTSPPTNGPAAYTYTWSQLTNTIRQIILAEKITGTQSWVNAASTNTGSYNTGDHSDHIYSSYAVQDAIGMPSSHAVTPLLTWVGVNGFRDYNSSSYGANLNSVDHENASAIFGLTNWGLIEAQYATNFNSGHKVWLPMDYFEVLRTPSGSAPFAGTGGGTDGSLDNGFSGKDLPGNHLTEIPMIVSITGPAFAGKEIAMIISPYETGTLTTSVLNENGVKVYEQKTVITDKSAPLLVTLKQPVKAKGDYVIQNTLNDKYTETRKIVVEQ